MLDVGDIERVHDMRVATRRLRAALEIFEPCFRPKAFSSALAQVKAIADALGERRDCDVAIAALEDLAAEMPAPDRPGARTLIERLRAEQTEANAALAPFVDAGRLAALSELLYELVAAASRSAARPHVKARRVKKLDPVAPLADNAARSFGFGWTSCSRSPRRLCSPSAFATSTTCASPRSGFATSSR